MITKLKKIKFNDLTESKVMIIQKGNQVYNVMKFGYTLLHRHPFIKLAKLNEAEDIPFENVCKEEFDNSNFKLVYINEEKK